MAKEKASNTALEEVPQQAVATQSPDQVIGDMMAQDAGAGLKNLGANDFAVPFFQILQKGSPQVSRANAKYIKGAEVGMILNTLTGDMYPGFQEQVTVDGDVAGILYAPCGYQKQMVRWKSRDSGGGLVCHYLEGDPILKTFKRNERGQLYDEDTKDLIIDTAYHYGLLRHTEGFPEFGVISMASTALKVSRTWNTIMKRIMLKTADGRIFNPPSYSHIYRLTTVGQTKDTYDWYTWKVISEGKVEDVELYKMARKFSADIEAGLVRVSAPPQDFVEEEHEEVPF